MKNRNLSVLLIGDEERRNPIKRGLRASRNVRLAGEIAEASALRLVPHLDAELVVLDFAAERVNGTAALCWLATLPGERRIVVLGASGTAAERKLAFELGAAAYATVDSASVLLESMIASGQPHGAPHVAEAARAA